jgi:phasin
MQPKRACTRAVGSGYRLALHVLQSKFAPNQRKTGRSRRATRRIVQTLPQRMSAMTARAQSQATKATPQVLHDLAEKSVAQAKENFEKMNAAAGEATSQMKDTYSVTFKGVQDYHTKVLEFAHANINAAFEHARKLSSVRSPAEFFSLSNDHLRQQFEILSRQAQELAAIAQKMTAGTTESIKAGVQKVA